MRGLVQRVTQASVTVEGHVVGAIGSGLCVLVGVTHDDTEATARKLADKIWGLRIIDDEHGVMNRSVADSGGSVLVVSQFTLYGDTSGGRRPSWIKAARPEHAEPRVPRAPAFQSDLANDDLLFADRGAVEHISTGGDEGTEPRR